MLEQQRRNDNNGNTLSSRREVYFIMGSIADKKILTLKLIRASF